MFNNKGASRWETRQPLGLVILHQFKTVCYLPKLQGFVKILLEYKVWKFKPSKNVYCISAVWRFRPIEIHLNYKFRLDW